jgi:hypothetical protein
MSSQLDQITLEWDAAMRQARAITKVMPEFTNSHSREELLTLAHSIFLRNAIAALPHNLGPRTSCGPG